MAIIFLPLVRILDRCVLSLRFTDGPFVVLHIIWSLNEPWFVEHWSYLGLYVLLDHHGLVREIHGWYFRCSNCWLQAS